VTDEHSTTYKPIFRGETTKKSFSTVSPYSTHRGVLSAIAFVDNEPTLSGLATEDGILALPSG
jgi:hypothetical protein